MTAIYYYTVTICIFGQAYLNDETKEGKIFL